uniref:Uncharacterized protein n=1 Tax=Rhizophora mucronata TaxID=61149 RepID=A0A2P2JZ05_RHIMU
MSHITRCLDQYQIVLVTSLLAR